MEIATATMKELINYFNANSGKPPVKKFADRKTAEKRVAALTLPAAPPTEPTKDEDEMAKAKTKPAAKKKAASPADRAKAISDSWADKAVREARSTHNKVVVAGETYRSVREAFKALTLMDSRHIKFRRVLKTAVGGKATYEEDGKKYNFKVVAAD